MNTDDRMFSLTINPRFCDTDAMGHINNTVYPVWFLEGRESVLKIFNPNLATEEVSLVLAKLERYEEAISIFDKVLSIDPNLEEAKEFRQITIELLNSPNNSRNLFRNNRERNILVLLFWMIVYI